MGSSSGSPGQGSNGGGKGGGGGLLGMLMNPTQGMFVQAPQAQPAQTPPPGAIQSVGPDTDTTAFLRAFGFMPPPQG